MDHPEEKLLTTTEVCQLLADPAGRKPCRSRISTWVRDGFKGHRLPRQTWGRYWYFRRADVEQFRRVLAGEAVQK